MTESFGVQSSTVDPELELLLRQGSLVMAILKHVDDLKMIGARQEIEKFIPHLSRTFCKMEIEWKDFTFCGVHHVQDESGDISMDQIKFLAACKPIVAPAALNGAGDKLLAEETRRHFLSLLMTVAYGLLTRPDVAVYVTALQRESHQAQVVHVRRLNALLKWLQANPRKLTYPKMSYPTALVQISDAAFKAKAEDGLSVRGLISVRICLNDIVQGKAEAKCHMVDWVSKAQRHVTRSTFSSELFAATDAVDIGLLNTVALHELAHGVVSASEARQLVEGSKTCSVALGLVIDAKSVSSAVVAPRVKVPAEPSLLLHVFWLRELLASGRLQHMWWADTRSMVADGMTKGSVLRDMIQAVMAGTLLMPQSYIEQKLSS